MLFQCDYGLNSDNELVNHALGQLCSRQNDLCGNFLCVIDLRRKCFYD